MKKWIVADPEHLGGSPRVRGTRISVALILESLAAGLLVHEIVDALSESDRGVGARRPCGTGASERITAGVKILLDAMDCLL